MKLFPKFWKIEEVSAVCSEIVDCLNKTAPSVDRDTGFKMIRTTNVKGGRINLEDVRFVEEPVFRNWTRRLLPRRNDIVLTREAPLGEVGLLRSDDQVMLGQRTMAYRADGKRLDQKFLYYSLLGPILQAQIKMLGSGSTVEHMRVPDAEALAIPVPPIAEQRKIASLLSTYDDLIENNRQRIALLERMAEQLYREWFIRFRFPGYQQARFRKGIPADWAYEPIEGLCVLIKRGISPVYADGVTARVLNQRCIRDGSIDMSPARWHSTKVPNEKCIRFGDVLINSTGVGTLGRVAVVDWTPNELSCDSHITICRANREAVGVAYFALTLQRLQPYFEYMASGSTGQAELGRRTIATTKVLSPSRDLQLQFDRIVIDIWKKARVLKDAIGILERTRDLLLPRLISGKLRVDDLDIQFPPSMQDAAA